nr:uncharacterized protein LOC127303938 [Lolium perenne]
MEGSSSLSSFRCSPAPRFAPPPADAYKTPYAAAKVRPTRRCRRSAPPRARPTGPGASPRRPGSSPTSSASRRALNRANRVLVLVSGNHRSPPIPSSSGLAAKLPVLTVSRRSSPCPRPAPPRLLAPRHHGTCPGRRVPSPPAMLRRRKWSGAATKRFASSSCAVSPLAPARLRPQSADCRATCELKVTLTSA